MRIPLGLFAFALVVRAILIALYPDPAYPDSYYYVDVARALHAGQGFNVDFIWAFVETGGVLPADPHLPIPSNAHWLPLASLIQLPFMAVLGTAAWVSDIPFALIGATAAPLTWFIARDMGARPAVAIGASLMTAVPAATTVFFGQPDNFSLYQPLGRRGDLARDAGPAWRPPGAARSPGCSSGLASLARNDGILIGAALALVFLWDRWRAWRSAGERRAGHPLVGRVRELRPVPRRGRAVVAAPAVGLRDASRRRRRTARSCSSGRSPR